MSKASIYSVNGGKEIAYQMGNSRVVRSKDGKGRNEVKENGEWRPARGYFKPYFVENVKEAVEAS